LSTGDQPPSHPSEDEKGHWSPEIDHPLAVHMTVPPLSLPLHASRARAEASHSPELIEHQKLSLHDALGPHAVRILLQNDSHSGVPDRSFVGQALPMHVCPVLESP
jgi:hypothetical protein